MRPSPPQCSGQPMWNCQCSGPMNTGASTQALVIVAGPVGLTTALALRACGVEVIIVGPAYDPAKADWRTTALLPGSIELLKNLRIWAACERHAAPLEGVRLVDD